MCWVNGRAFLEESTGGCGDKGEICSDVRLIGVVGGERVC